MTGVKKSLSRWLILLPAVFLLAQKAPDEAVSFPATVHSDLALAKLEHKDLLTSLTLDGNGITDVGLAELKDLPLLTKLMIRSDKVTDAGIKNIDSLPKLKSLFLFCGPKVTDATAKTAGEKTRLEELVLNGTSVTDKGLSYLDKLSALTFLAVENSKLNGSGLAELRKLQHLKLLSLLGNNIHGKALSSLEALPIVSLTLNGNPLGDEGVEQVAKIKTLTGSLNLEYTNITGATVPALRKLSGLTNMSLSHNNLSTSKFSALAQMSHLGRLKLCECALNDESLKELGKVNQLVMLDLSNDPLHLEDNALATHKDVRAFKNRFDDRGLDYLKSLKNMRALDVSFVTLSSSALRKMQRALPGCRFKLTMDLQEGKPD